MAAISLGPSPARREALAHRIRLLVAVTITYNVIEAVAALTAGTIASSTALIGFGLDSVIEVSSAAAVAWQFSARDHAVREAREHRTLRIISVSFFALAAYVTIDTVCALAGTGEADRSLPGIVLAALSLAVMPFGCPAARRTRTRLRLRGRRLQADPAVHLPLGRAPGRPGPQRHPRLILGRPRRRPRHRRHRREGKPRRLAGQRLLRPDGRIRGCPISRRRGRVRLPARLHLLLMNISLQAALTTVRSADTDRVIGKRGRW